MAGLGPQGAPPGAMPPGGLPPGGPPPGMPGPMPPPGAMPPGMPPMGGMPPPGMANPISDPFTDLSESMSHEYQLVDIASRTLKKAVETGSFYQKPDVLAGLRALIHQLDDIVSTYSKPDDHDISAAPMGETAGMGESDEPDEDES